MLCKPERILLNPVKNLQMTANRFTQHLISFARALRRAGFEIGTGQIMDALRALKIIGIRSRTDVYHAFFSIFVTRREHMGLFDQAFHLFWRAPARLPEIMSLILPQLHLPQMMDTKKSLRVQQALSEGDSRQKKERPQRENKEKEAVDLVLTYSATEVLRKKDFAQFTVEEVVQAKRLLADMQWSIAERRTRRFTSDTSGRLLDLRRTVRHNLRYHGEMIHLRKLTPETRPRNLTILCDISGSMERYSRMLLHFMHAMSCDKRRVETFVFGTRLTRITRTLRQRDIDDAISSVSKLVNDWAGGTRIGAALKEFNYVWARRVLRSGAMLLIISDGWDRGEIPLLAQEVERLSRNCHRLIWLNPLLGYKDYEPLTRGMKAVLPYIDDFLPVHNLASLEQVAAVLSKVR